MNEALSRIENNTFGICVMCKEQINRNRLEAIPYTKFCLECKANEEIH